MDLQIEKHKKESVQYVHLIISYCLQSLQYLCKTWSSNISSVHSAKIAVHNSFRQIFNRFSQESIKCCCSIAVRCQLYIKLICRHFLLQKDKVSQQCSTSYHGSRKNVSPWNFVILKQVKYSFIIIIINNEIKVTLSQTTASGALYYRV